MTEVILYGELAERFGKSWKFDIRKPIEFVRALDANCDRKFVQYLHEHGDQGYRILIDDQDITNIDELRLESCPRKLHVMPVYSGAGNSGGWLIVIGVALIAVAAVFSFGAAGAAAAAAVPGGVGAAAPVTVAGLATATFSGFTGVIATMGVSLILGGIAQLVIGAPDVPDNERPENQPSKLFNGPVNTYRQGNPVPVLYGMLRCGSQVISAGVTTVDVPI